MISIRKIKTKIQYKALLCFLFLMFLTSANVTFASETVNVYALDTIAGVSTRVQTSKTKPNSSIDFQLKKPDGTVIDFESMTNTNGIAYAEISDYHTRISGDYFIRAKLGAVNNFSGFNSFEVFPSSVSTLVSTLYPENQMVQTSADTALVSVKLVDDFANPIEGHMVKLLSSDNESDIDYYSSNTTDSEGVIVFRVRSNKSGPVTYTAYDVSADAIISDRAKVGFYSNSVDFEYAASGAPSGLISGLVFEDIPDEIGTGEVINFTLRAVDDEDETVTDYTGTVRFSVLSDNASYVTLPEDYEFQDEDLGEHTFSLTLSFLQPGEYVIEARDLDSPDIFGEYIFTVEDLFPTGSSGVESDIEIENPVSGTYSNNVVVVSGTAPASSTLNIYDNEIKLDTVSVDADGEYLYTSPALVDGEHSVYLTIEDSDGTILDESEEVNFIIDTSAPEIASIEFDPEGDIEAGAELTISLDISDDLSQAAMVFNDNIYEFNLGDNGLYTVTFSAPDEPGEYSFDFILLDELGNESRFSAEASINVIEAEVVEPVLGPVANLIATPDDNKIILNWIEPALHDNPISNYRIYFGTDPENLNNVVDTFDESTTWYIPNLTNGQEYYFAAIAVDEMGYQSSELSNVAKSVPAPAVVLTPPPEVEQGLAGNEELMDMEEDASDSGPEVLWLLLFSVVAGYFYTNSSRFGLIIQNLKKSVSKFVR